MKSLALTLFACCGVLAAWPAASAPRSAAAAVRLASNGLPCFTLAQREEQGEPPPTFQAISVRRQGRRMWQMQMPRERSFPLRFTMCIPYAGRIPALPQTAATALQRGVLYTVQLDVRPGKRTRAPLRYVANFCLLPQTDGQVALRPTCALQ